jgi:hypothetical protein
VDRSPDWRCTDPETGGKKLVSQWALRQEGSEAVIRVGQLIEESPFDDGDPGPLVASWVQYDPRRELQEVVVGTVFLDRLGRTENQAFFLEKLRHRWRQLRPAEVLYA